MKYFLFCLKLATRATSKSSSPHLNLIKGREQQPGDSSGQRRQDINYPDVTFAPEEEQRIGAHKVVLKEGNSARWNCSSTWKIFANTTKMDIASLEKIAKEIITIKLVKIYLTAEKTNAQKDIQKSANTLRLRVNADIRNVVPTNM